MGRRYVRILDRGHTFVLRGWRAHDLAMEADVKTVFNGVAGGWVGDGKRLGDLVAYLEYRNVSFAVVADGDDAA